jgi:hypothetical protein
MDAISAVMPLQIIISLSAGRVLIATELGAIQARVSHRQCFFPIQAPHAETRGRSK